MSNPAGDAQIANMALSRIGATQVVQGLEGNYFSDNTPSAQQLNVWYWQDRLAELTEFPWPFASKYAPLSQVSTLGIPANPEYGISYRYPSDCLAVRRIVCGQVVTGATPVPPLTTNSPPPMVCVGPQFRADGDPYPWPFEIGSDATGRLVYTNAFNAWIKYTYDAFDAMQYSADFADLLAWRVAMDLYGMARENKRREECAKMYEKRKLEVRARFLNEMQNSQPQIEYNSETIRARYIG